jgi:tetratricopeptide (TPR) repeat protein
VAILDCTKAIEIIPEFEQPIRIGFRLHCLGKPEWVIADCNEAIALISNLYLIILIVDLAMPILAQYERAIEDYNTAIENRLENWTTLFQSWECYVQLGRYMQALRFFYDFLIMSISR